MGCIVAVTRTQKEKITNLVKEGKNLAAVRRENVPEANYGDIHAIAQKESGGSSLGIKRTITNRLKNLSTAKSEADKARLVDIIQVLVNDLYRQHKYMADKLDQIRKIMK